MKTIKTMMKPLLALILLLAVAPYALPARADGTFAFCCPDADVLNIFRIDAEAR